MGKELASVGHHFIVGLSGAELLETERSLLRELRPLGIILFGKNLRSASPEWRRDLLNLLDEVKSAVNRPHLFISIDHEGGRVHRFPPPVTRFPAAKYWQEHAGEVAAAMGRELRALGFNLDFAPVLDIHSEPANTVIGDRAFGTDADAVVRYAEQVIDGLHSEGVLSCGKHFPGHGDTLQDSHLVLPSLDAEAEQLKNRELLPFAAMIAQGLPLLMSAHVRYSALDPQYPASLSRTILQDLLRGELGYQKALITDDLEMKALQSYSPEERGLLALRAGTDILLEANPHPGVALETAAGMARAIIDEWPSGSAALRTSEKRIEDLLNSAAAISRAQPSAPPEDLSTGATTTPADCVGCEAHSRLASSITSARSA